jgi:hypothetical protein
MAKFNGGTKFGRVPIRDWELGYVGARLAESLPTCLRQRHSAIEGGGVSTGLPDRTSHSLLAGGWGRADLLAASRVIA